MLLCPLPIRRFRITQRFGQNPLEYARFGMKGHNGLDFAPTIPGTTGEVIYAPHDGYVHLGDEGNDGYGKYVEITSLPYNTFGDCRHSVLAHMDRFLVTDGKWIGAGDPIGIMGSTGFSTGIHTHWTYKVKRDSITQNHGNGFKGALNLLDPKSNVVVWVNTL